MVTKARELNGQIGNCSFVVNNSADLRVFPNETFDLIYSARVLQHLPSQKVIEQYVSEFARVLKSGGLLVFQIPTSISLRWRLQPRRRVYSLLRGLGVGKEFLYHKLGVFPMKMTHFPQHGIENLLGRLGIRLVKVERDLDSSPGMPGAKYYAVKNRLRSNFGYGVNSCAGLGDPVPLFIVQQRTNPVSGRSLQPQSLSSVRIRVR